MPFFVVQRMLTLLEMWHMKMNIHKKLRFGAENDNTQSALGELPFKRLFLYYLPNRSLTNDYAVSLYKSVT